MRTQLLGAKGEAAAADWLRKKKWNILAMNYRCRFGEVDIVARDGEEYVFVEVKLRRAGGYAPAAEYVTLSKQQKLRLAAQDWLVRNGLEDPPCRFDVAEVYLDRAGEKIEKINLISEAF